MEICDVLDEHGMRTGRTAVRGTILARGEYYLAVQVWIRNEAGEYLIQRRAAHLASGAGMWATTAGYVLAGESSIAGGVREVYEELGLQLSPAQLRLFDRLTMERQIEDVWIAEVPKQALGMPQLGSEVSDWQWASKDTLRQMISEGRFFAYSYFDLLPE